jgi:hypothetical protein
MREATGLPTFLADGSIIQEQDDHLVVAVRIPKATINANLHLFAALAESAGSGDRAVTAPPIAPAAAAVAVKRKKPSWTYAVLLFAASILPSPFGPVLVEGIAGVPAPVVYKDWEMPKTFEVGAPITVAVRFRRDRVCHTSFEQKVIRTSDGDVVHYNRVDAGNRPVTGGSGFSSFRMTLNLGAPLPVGDYTYAGITHSQCAMGGDYDEVHPRINFKIVAPA